MVVTRSAARALPSPHKPLVLSNIISLNCRRSLFADEEQAIAIAGAMPWPAHNDDATPRPCTPTGEEELAPEPSMHLSDEVELGQPTLQALRFWLEAWRTNLIALQPKVVIDDEAIDGAVLLVQGLFCRRFDLHDILLASAPHLAAYAAAALWSASKIVGVRTQSPNRSLMAQAAGCHPQALTAFELDLCCSLNWDMAAILRANGLLI